MLCQLTIRPALSLTLSDWFFLGALISVLLEIIVFNRKIEMRLPSLFVLSCLIVVAGGMLSFLNMNEKITGLSIVIRFIYLTIIWFWLGTMVLRTENHVQRATVFWLLSVAVTGIAAALQLLDPLIIPGTAPILGRMVGFTGHPNDLGALSAIGWGTAIVLFYHGKMLRNLLLVRYILLIAIISGLILSGSTGSALGAVAATALWLLLIRSKKQLTWLVIIMLTISIPLLTVQHIVGGKSLLNRLTETVIPTQKNKTTFSIRIETYEKALDTIIQNPLIGVGFKPGGSKTETGNAVHNAYIAVLYEAGLIGLIGMITLTLSSLISARYLFRKTNRFSTDRYFVIALSVSSIAFFVYAMGAPVLYQRYGWISLSLLFSLRAVIKRRTIVVNAVYSNKGYNHIALNRS